MPQRAYSLLNIDFSAALEVNNDPCSLVGWPTDIFVIFDNILICFRLRWDDPGSIQECPGGSQEHPKPSKKIYNVFVYTLLSLPMYITIAYWIT